MTDEFSDYGSGSSSNSTSSWLWSDKMSPPEFTRPKSNLVNPKSSSYLDLVMRKSTLEDVRREFLMNGSDSPYNPDEDRIWSRQPGELSGMGPAAPYLRQKSWPEPERTPAARMPRPHSLHAPYWNSAEFATSTPVFDGELSGMGPAAPYLRQKSWPEPERTPAARMPRPHSLHAPYWNSAEFATSTPVFDDIAPAPFTPGVAPSELFSEQLTLEQERVLNSLPDSVLYPLLRKLRADRRQRVPLECRFCKNNGERTSFYRSHELKDSSGRVSCPVLRAFTCRRCGVSGDYAHTIKYCPLSTNEERVKAAGMLRSFRMASGQRRHSIAPSLADERDYVLFGEPTPSVVEDTAAFSHLATDLDPRWAALEQKLSLSKFLA